jgi:hypothetical protein
VITFLIAGSTSAGSADSARPRLSATDSTSRAKRSMPNLRSFSISLLGAAADVLGFRDRPQMLVLQLGILGLQPFHDPLKHFDGGFGAVDRHVSRGAARG